MKLACLSSDSPRGLEGHRELSERYSLVDIDHADVIIALGGDGFLLSVLHTCSGLGKPVYGMNRGTVGFLMNLFQADNLLQRIGAARANVLSPLRMKAETVSGEVHEAIAFNEVAAIRYTGQSANLQVHVNGAERIDKLMCDGVLVSTAAGSTAYNFSAGGPIVPLNARVLALTPVSPFRPRRWRGALLPHDTVVELTNLDPKKRPVCAAADGDEIANVVTLEIREDSAQAVTVLFDPDHSLEDRIFNEQFTF